MKPLVPAKRMQAGAGEGQAQRARCRIRAMRIAWKLRSSTLCALPLSLGLLGFPPGSTIERLHLAPQSSSPGSCDVRGAIGITVSRELSPRIAHPLLTVKTGVLVSDVAASGPADRAGITRGDVIVQFDGQNVDSPDALISRIARATPGAVVPIALLHDGSVQTRFASIVALRPCDVDPSPAPVAAARSQAESQDDLLKRFFGEGTPGQTGTPVTQPPSNRAQENSVQDDIGRIRNGQHADLPRSQGRPTQGLNGASEYAVENSTDYVLTILMSGPSPQRVQIPPHAIQSIRVTPGTYEIAARVSDPSVIPYYGTESFSRDFQHPTQFYIRVRH